jgi:hypothetical protein
VGLGRGRERVCVYQRVVSFSSSRIRVVCNLDGSSCAFFAQCAQNGSMGKQSSRSFLPSPPIDGLHVLWNSEFGISVHT